MIDLARDHPELVQLRETQQERNLITQGQKLENVYLVLSGYLNIYVNGRLLTKDNEPIMVKTGDMLGEISALKGGLPTATVTGRASVLRISRHEFQRQLAINEMFRDGVEELVDNRLLEQN